MVKIGLIVFE